MKLKVWTICFMSPENPTGMQYTPEQGGDLGLTLRREYYGFMIYGFFVRNSSPTCAPCLLSLFTSATIASFRIELLCSSCSARGSCALEGIYMMLREASGEV